MSDSPTTTRSGFGGWWLASAALVLAVAVCAALVVIFGGGSGGGPQRAGGPSVTTTGATGAAPSTADSGGTSACTPSDTDQSIPTQAPTGVRWEIVNTVALPWSQTAGPAVHDGTTRRCFAHSPRGALVAAASLAVTTDSPGADKVFQTQVMPGPTRDARLRAAQSNPPQPKQAGETASIAGFRVLSYTSTTAVIQLAYAFGGKFGSETYNLVWDSGDWKLNLDPPGGAAPGQPLTSLTGFVPWGAV